MTSRQQHWESVYQQNDQELVGWYQANPTVSLLFIESCDVDRDAPIVNVGGGSSLLADRLLDNGFTDITVLDLSATALRLARERLGVRSDSVTWIEGDVTANTLSRSYQVWHDRAVFHFLTDPDSRTRYVEQLRKAVAIGGHVIIATFALDGPERCSGLPVERYGSESLSMALGDDFSPLRFEREIHRTPGGTEQKFLWGLFCRGPQI